MEKTRVAGADCWAMRRTIEGLQRQYFRTPLSHHATPIFSRASQPVISRKHAFSTASTVSPSSPSVLGSDLAPRLRGQQFRIPDLWPLFETWKRGVNREYMRVKIVVDAQLEGLIVGNEKALAEAKRAEPGLCAAAWFPDVTYDALETAALYSIWLILWDDAIDRLGPAAGDADNVALAAEEYCWASLRFVRHHLWLDEGDHGIEEPAAPTKICDSFRDVAVRLRRYVEDVKERRRLFEHLAEFMEGVMAEYRCKMSGQAQSLDEFYSVRLKTVSVKPLLELSRLLNRISVPQDVLESSELDNMALDVAKIGMIVNDLFSLKKELKDETVTNMVTATMSAHNLDLRGAVAHAIREMQKCIQRFDANSAALQRKAVQDHGEAIEGELKRLIQAYQAIVTGTLHFSYNSPRYRLPKQRKDDGSLVVEL